MKKETIKCTKFCNRCIYTCLAPTWIGNFRTMCNHSSNRKVLVKNTWKEKIEKVKYIKKPSYLNRNNNCSNFKDVSDKYKR